MSANLYHSSDCELKIFLIVLPCASYYEMNSFSTFFGLFGLAYSFGGWNTIQNYSLMFKYSSLADVISNPFLSACTLTYDRHSSTGIYNYVYGGQSA